ncbi:glycoside hydrolase family 108 protein [Microvirga guangxiensis]|uniref:Lysozyme family protein n=1 Tax=Microvirga guangxiensis TaxID=549386 RepID=A0A1G5C2M6_9HYPH|nr:glycosyl hydrolase 108 family protein [Microvirga guangxiensis]SCX96567.1 Lysozyme family protein [Microvirga guangxiensis]
MPASSSFETALAQVLKHEGGFVWHPQDPGGATNFGITVQTLSRARGQPASAEDVHRLTMGEASSIYRRFYWDVLCADELPRGVDLALFDFAVNSGPRQAVMMLQRVLGVEADGLVGPITLEAVRRADAVDTIRRLTRRRLGFLSRLAIWPVFGRGWRRRVLHVEREAILLASSFTPQHGISNMIDTKAILASRTIWANLIGLVAVILGLFGFEASALSAGAFQEALVQFIAAGSFIASTVFRILATKQITN